MTQPLFEVGKHYWTRGDEKHPKELRRVICIDAPGDYPVIAILASGIPIRYTLKGFYYSSGRTDYEDLLPGSVESDKPKTRYYKWKIKYGSGCSTDSYVSEDGKVTNGNVWSDDWHSIEKEKINPDTDFVDV